MSYLTVGEGLGSLVSERRCLKQSQFLGLLGPRPCLPKVLRSRLRSAHQAPRGGRTSVQTVALRDKSSHYYRAAPLTAWSPIRSLLSLSKFFFITGAATTTAWYAHPQLLNLAAHVLHLDFKDSVTAFQTSFFSFLSLVFAIYSGNTMAFLYDRQKQMVQNLYAECMALEELLEESINTLGPDARDILAQIRVYIDSEIYSPENQSPPLGDGFALNVIRAKARNYRRAGTDVGEILQASQRLAHAQSERQATACRLLPPIHWALLYTIGSLFVSTFILFETGGSFSNEGRHILFTVLCGLMTFVLVALRDLADPAEGVYNATALLEERLSYVKVMLDKYQKLPTAKPGQAATHPVSASVAVAGPEDATSPGLLNSVVTAIKSAVGDEAEVHETHSKESERSHEHSNNGHSKSRPVLHANLSVTEKSNGASTPSTAPVMPSGGVTAALGVGRPAPVHQGNHRNHNHHHHQHRVRQNAHHHLQSSSSNLRPRLPQLAGLPPGAQQTGVHRLVGMPASSSWAGKTSTQTQFKRQLGSRASLREPVPKDATLTNSPRPANAY